MGDFSDDYGGYDMLGIYERCEDERRAQRAKLLTPPRRAWVGLTDEDVFAVLKKLQDMYHRPPIAIFAQAIEAKLKEKNT